MTGCPGDYDRRGNDQWETEVLRREGQSTGSSSSCSAQGLAWARHRTPWWTQEELRGEKKEGGKWGRGGGGGRQGKRKEEARGQCALQLSGLPRVYEHTGEEVCAGPGALSPPSATLLIGWIYRVQKM